MGSDESMNDFYFQEFHSLLVESGQEWVQPNGSGLFGSNPPESTAEVTFHKVDGILHRTDGPAIEWIDERHQEWWFEGKRHNLNGPAILWKDGSKFYFVNGKRHRTDGPAIEYSNL